MSDIDLMLQERFLSEMSKKYGLASNWYSGDVFTVIQQTDLEIEGDPLVLQTEVTAYPNKLDYLFVRWQEDQDVNVPVRVLDGHLGRVCDTMWSVNYKRPLTEYSTRSRTILLVDIMKSLRDNIAGGMGDDKLVDGDALVSYPYGIKAVDGPTMASWKEGQRQREKFDMRFGMGAAHSDGWCYATYTDGKISPL